MPHVKPLEKKRFFKALENAGAGSVKVAEAETPNQSDRQRRRSIQEDLEAAFGGTETSVHGYAAGEASPVSSDSPLRNG